jgi:molybdopterin molybdotransferase
MISVKEADRLLQEHVRIQAPVAVPLPLAAGRILREDVAADRDYPPFDRVAMDGIAINVAAHGASLARFPVEAVQRAGEPQRALSNPVACLEVMTGATLPAGCDTVIRYEDLTIANGEATLSQDALVKARQNVHHRATDRKQGETILTAGIRLGPPQIAVLASVGRVQVQVAPLLRFTVITTGDELVDLHEPVLPHQIRRSNAYAIQASLARNGAEAIKLMHARDEEAGLEATLRQALEASDVLLLSGGVSMGKFDLVPQMLAKAGIAQVFHRIAQKPGKPLWFGVRSDGRPVFGLPGNPVSALVCLYRYVLPFLDLQAGKNPISPHTVWLRQLPKVKKDFTAFVPVRLNGFSAEAIRENGSGDFASLAESDGFVEVCLESAKELQGGYEVPFFAWGRP